MTWTRCSLVSCIALAGTGCFDPPQVSETDSLLTLGSASATTTDDGGTTDGPDPDTSTGPGADSTSTGPGVDSTSTGPGDGTSTGEPPGVCGDGELGDDEACDDGNPDDGDGCSATCEEEPGFQCMGQPSVCESTCGDGVVASDEACDDGDMMPGDGCTACMVDPGFECLGAMPSVCTPLCGDGMLIGGESCDDGNMMDGDGCASDCMVELYSRCDGAGPGSCAPIRILYAPADNDDPAFRMAMGALTGGPVDYMDAGAMSPTLPMLQADYDCVFTHPNFSYVNPMAFGNDLAAFVDGGGNVVLGIATDYMPPTGFNGTPIMLAAYSPVSTAGSVQFDPVTYAGDGTSPLHTGVMAYASGIYDTGVVLQGMGVQDSTFVGGTIAVAYRPDFKVVYVNGTGNESFNGTGDWTLLVTNACAVGFL